MMDISLAFKTTGETIKELFRGAGPGFYVPLYQRPYSWDRENVEQLLDDIVSGVDEVVRGNTRSIRFLGTIIAISDQRHQSINPKDLKALPAAVDIIIDGQQRLSTISLLATVIDLELHRLYQAFPSEQPYSEAREAILTWRSALANVYSLDLERGEPSRKPKIIRGGEDRWTFSGTDAEYMSPVSNYLAQYIRWTNSYEGRAPVPKDDLVKRNIGYMRRTIHNIAFAHIEQSDLNGRFPTSSMIVSAIPEDNLWTFPRPDLKNIASIDFLDTDSPESLVAEATHIFAFCHYLFHHCCVTLIKPSDEDWAFDMFQSLNATGTPLTAIETFKPQVVRAEHELGSGYENSPSAHHFEKVEELYSGLTTAAAKSKMTNRLLVSFALAWDGTKLPSRFSGQRSWLHEKYESGSINNRRRFTESFATMAEFQRYVWDGYDGGNPLELLDGMEEDLVSTCLLFLKDSNHRISASILAPFYGLIAKAEEERRLEVIRDFTSAVKTITAFYVLWRSVKSNSGLDAAYRSVIRGSELDNGIKWSTDTGAELSNLKTYLIEQLRDTADIHNRNEWLARAQSYVGYDRSKNLCRFILFLAAHDTVPDDSSPGLMKRGTFACSSYLTPEKWTSPALKEIEHIAPAKVPAQSDWDPGIYESNVFHRIGNLTLLPKEINSSASNKNYNQKLLYYQHLGLNDPDRIAELRKKAQSEGMQLSAETIQRLREAAHQSHLTPILLRSASEGWDSDFIELRGARICTFVWDRMTEWLQVDDNLQSK
jgi:hypothetical protein